MTENITISMHFIIKYYVGIIMKILAILLCNIVGMLKLHERDVNIVLFKCIAVIDRENYLSIFHVFE